MPEKLSPEASADGKMDFKCPGSKIIRQPMPEFLTCSKCGEEVELWTNERMRKCDSCGNTVVRELDNAWCVQWCQYAKECIGVERYEELLEAGILDQAAADGDCIPEKLKKFIKEAGMSLPGEDVNAQNKESE